MVANKTLQKMLGYTEAEIAEIPFGSWTYPPDRAKDEQLFRELVNGQRDSYRVEKRYVRKNGDLFWAQLNTSISRDPRHHPEFLVGMIEDITERKHAEDTLASIRNGEVVPDDAEQ